MLKLTLTLVVVVMSLLTGRIALQAKPQRRLRPALGVGEAFAAGVFLGAGLIHMLGDADAAFVMQGIDFPFAPMICGVVMLALLWIEHLGQRPDQQVGHQAAVLPLTALAMLSVHSVLMGAAFGITTSLSIAMAVFIAVLAHKGAASFALGLELARSGVEAKKQWRWFLVFVSAYPLGVALGQAVGHFTGAHLLVEASFSAVAAGTFLFFGTLHGLALSPMIARCCNPREFLGAMLGFALMALVAIWT